MEDFICGRNSVLELLSESKRNITKIILAKGMHENEKINKIINLSKEKGILFQFVPKEKFLKYSEYTHQGVIAFVAPVEYTNFYDFLNEKTDKFRKIILLDGIEDPHNLGSIIRTAVCAGYDAVVLPTRRSCIVNATVDKSSAGAVNHIKIIVVNSLSDTVKKLKDNNYWIIATSADSNDNYYDIDYTDMNFALVMGAEGTGITGTIIKHSDFKVKIPMMNNFNSLNVSNAASIIMYESVKQISQKSKL